MGYGVGVEIPADDSGGENADGVFPGFGYKLE
jgi:hypothetical protein